MLRKHKYMLIEIDQPRNKDELNQKRTWQENGIRDKQLSSQLVPGISHRGEIET